MEGVGSCHEMMHGITPDLANKVDGQGEMRIYRPWSRGAGGEGVRPGCGGPPWRASRAADCRVSYMRQGPSTDCSWATIQVELPTYIDV